MLGVTQLDVQREAAHLTTHLETEGAGPEMIKDHMFGLLVHALLRLGITLYAPGCEDPVRQQDDGDKDQSHGLEEITY
jgi:hypothetical protein